MVSVLIKSYGCSASMNDGEIMAGLLEKAGHKLVDKPEAAEVIIINTCIVKGRTESRMRNIISKLSKEYPKKKLIVAGCMPQVGLKAPAKNVSKIGPHNIEEIVRLVDGRKRNLRATGKIAAVKAGLPKKPGNRNVNIVQILEGCSGACAYCIVKQAKPVLLSFPSSLIISDIKEGLNKGAKEVWLTSQDNASYGREKKDRYRLPNLLKEICEIDGRFFVRVGMMNPDTIMPVLDELIEAYKSPKVFKFLHIPVQSGNDRILKLMNRKYSVADFKKVITKFRKAIPDITISTDIIVGFPSETEDEFQDSMRLLRWLKPNVLNLSRFFPRPNTAAEKMKSQVHGNITKVRSEDMAALFAEIAKKNNRRWLGWQGEVYIDEVGKKDRNGKSGSFVGRNNAYKPVVIVSDKDLLGRSVQARIVETRKSYLIGVITNQKRL